MNETTSNLVQAVTDGDLQGATKMGLKWMVKFEHINFPSKTAEAVFYATGWLTSRRYAEANGEDVPKVNANQNLVRTAAMFVGGWMVDEGIFNEHPESNLEELEKKLMAHPFGTEGRDYANECVHIGEDIRRKYLGDDEDTSAVMLVFSLHLKIVATGMLGMDIAQDFGTHFLIYLFDVVLGMLYREGIVKP